MWIWQKIRKHFRKTFYQSPWYYTGFAFCQGHYWPHLIDELGLDKGGKGGDGFNKVEIDSKRLIGGGVCMFVHVGPWCQLDAFYFHLFLEGDCFVNSFLLSHSLRKIRLKTVWSRPPNSSKLAWKATILLIWKVIQTHHHQPNHSNRIPTLCSRIFIGACWIITWNSESKISLKFHFRSEFKAGSTSGKEVISSKLNSNF